MVWLALRCVNDARISVPRSMCATRRPLLMSSTIAAMLASRAGFRKPVQTTNVPNSTHCVVAAIAGTSAQRAVALAISPSTIGSMMPTFNRPTFGEPVGLRDSAGF